MTGRRGEPFRPSFEPGNRKKAFEMKCTAIYALAIGALTAGLASTANANVTIQYTGNAFTSVTSPLAGSGLFGDVVLKNFDTTVASTRTASDVVDWSLSNGAFTLSKSTGDLLTRASFDIAAGGAVTSWFFDAASDLAGDETSQTASIFEDTSTIRSPQAYSGTFQNQSFVPGSWTPAAAVPEPDAWALLVTGFICLGGFARSQRRKGPLAS